MGKYEKGYRHLKISKVRHMVFILVLSMLFSALGAFQIPSTSADGGEKFTVAIFPDTQNEVAAAGMVANQWFKNRTLWLAENAQALNLKFALHTGDMMNWPGWEVIMEGTDTQLTIASEGMGVLDDAGIPYLVALGNHDSCATAEGGSGWENNPLGKDINALLRYTVHFNEYFPTERFPGIVQFEPGKSDNAFRTFEAGGKKWLAMALEFCPRTEVIEWANDVVYTHSDYNVLIATHSYLGGNGSISTSNAGYGDNSPMYLYNNLIKLYPNIKFVFSGHTGNAARREDTGVHGNKIVSILGAFHSTTTNPVQLLEIDTAANTAQNRYYGPLDGDEFSSYGWSFTGMDYVEPGTQPISTATPEPTPPNKGNAMVNPGFETDPVAIHTISNATMTRDTEVKRNGNASLKMSVGSESVNWPFFIIEMIPGAINWRVGAQYGWSCWAYSESAMTRPLVSRIRWSGVEGDLQQVDYYQTPQINVGGGVGWARSSGVFTIEPTASLNQQIKLWKLYINAASQADVDIYFDDMYFYELTAPTRLIASEPGGGEVVPAGNSSINVEFNYPIDVATLTSATVSAFGAEVSGIDIEEGSRVATVNFAAPLTEGRYEINFSGTIKDLFGRFIEPANVTFFVGQVVENYSFDSFDFYEGGAKTDNIKPSSEIKAVVTGLTNNTGSAGKPHLFAALYKDNRLVKIGVADAALLSGEILPTLEVGLQTGDLSDGEYTLKAFLWESTVGIAPIHMMKIDE